MSARWVAGASVVACLSAAGCGSRPSYWSTPVATVASYGLSGGVALVDNGDHRVVLLSPQADQGLATPLPISVGHNITSVTPSPDGSRLFVLSSGDPLQRLQGADPPSLTVITLDPTTFAASSHRYDMPVPLANLAIDPFGRWAVAYAGATDTQSFVQNPNEIVIFDLNDTAAPIARNLQSFGGTPQILTFTPELTLPGGARRLLILESEIDVTMLDLTNSALAMPPPEITVRLTSGSNAQQVTPAGVVVDGFSPDPSDARIALRAVGDRNVFTFTFGPAAAGNANGFVPIPNLTDVGGVPSDIAFVRTDQGLRVAALVPSTSSAMLIDPDTSVTTQVALPTSYSSMSLVTSIVPSASAGTDVAMLWNGATNAASGVALWSLGITAGQPYISVEVLGVSQAIQDVEDVAPPHPELKVLEALNSNTFFVLNLTSRTVAPLHTSGPASLAIAPDGLRLWAFAQGGKDLAQVDFGTLSPVPLTTDQPIDAVYDVARSPAAGNGRSLIAIHRAGGVGATVFDALSPTAAQARIFPALFLEGP